MDELCYEIETFLKNETINHTDRFNVHFARMGGPSFNSNVLVLARDVLKDLVGKYINAKTIHPVVSTMLPKSNINLEEFILKWCDIKNNIYNGEVGLQFSINSTDDKQRQEQFNNMILSLEEISILSKNY